LGSGDLLCPALGGPSAGQERTEEEFTALLAAAGLDLARIIPIRSPLSIIEAVRPQ
jgi:hypothetical protein